MVAGMVATMVVMAATATAPPTLAKDNEVA
jgi:hypothetical protein